MSATHTDSQLPVIYVVDDDASVRTGLSRLMESMGWKVQAHASAIEFFEHYQPVRIGCLVLDVQMPEMTGPQLQELMLVHEIALPVIFLTAHGDLPTGIKAMKNGAVDFLQKPADESALFQAIERALSSQIRREAEREQADDLRGRLSRLSGREREVMQLVIQGKLNKQIADTLGISMTTVKKHRAKVMEKMQVNSVAELVTLCQSLSYSATHQSVIPETAKRLSGIQGFQ